MLKNLVPPLLYDIYLKSRRVYGYFGEYGSWKEAQSKCGGYNNEIIFEKVKESALKVKRGEAAYERDSVLFSKIEISSHILASLLWIASKNKNTLKVLDFGGALGTTYYQNRKFLNHIELSWSIIEQPKFVEYGKKYFQDAQLNFFNDIKEYSQTPDCLILSSVLQYLEAPYEVLNKLFEANPKYVLFDKTPFLQMHGDKITIQKVPPHIYTASYPSWIFDLDKFLDFLKINKYTLVSEIGLPEDKMFTFKNKKVAWKGFLFEKNE